MLYAVGVGWLVWDGMRWKPVPVEFISSRVSTYYRDQFEKATTAWMRSGGMEEKYEILAKMYRAFMSSSRLNSILNHLKVTAKVLVEASSLDAHPELLNTPAGILDLRTGEVAPHDPAMLFTKVTRGSYRGRDFTHPDWETALTALPVEDMRYMQLRFGQAIVGQIPESDDCVFLVGHGSNGKSLWASDGILRALGDYGALSPATLISSKQSETGPSPERFGLRGVRLSLIEELPEGRSLSVAEVKRITGTSIITARDLHEKFVSFTASHTLFITTNYLPSVAEVDAGSWRRLCRVDFPFRFRAQPVSDDDRQGDPGLKARIRAGKDGQHDAILTWMVNGALRYFEDPGAIMEDRRPPSIAGATLEWRKEADRILAYVEARLEVTRDPKHMVAKSDLYTDFTRFLTEMGHNPWSQETFASRFKGHERIAGVGVKEAQTRGADGVSRPVYAPIGGGWSSSSVLPPLPKVPRVFRGVRFKTD
jgi:P4 family phage/plasmid primase-like protien